MTGLLDGVGAVEAPRHRQDGLVAVPHARIGSDEHDRVPLREERKVVVGDNGLLDRRPRIGDRARVAQERLLLIAGDHLGVGVGDVCLAGHLLEGVQHGVIRGLEESVNVIASAFYPTLLQHYLQLSISLRRTALRCVLIDGEDS